MPTSGCSLTYFTPEICYSKNDALDHAASGICSAINGPTYKNYFDSCFRLIKAMLASNSPIAELEAALQSGSLDKRIASMRHVTDLFLSSAENLNDEQVDLFDNVLVRLAEQIETKALSELSQRLAPVRNAPIGVIQKLARHDDISVAGPVLSNSERLTASDLIEIAKKRGDAHLLAISSRPRLVEAVTDTLLKRGSNEVFCKLAQNSGALFSNTGFKSLTERARNDEVLAEKVGQRADVPRHLLNDLVSKATNAVRIKLQATLPAELQAEIKGALATISRNVVHEIGAEIKDIEGAQEFVLNLQQKNQLNEPVLFDFAKKCELERLAAAIALMTSTRFEFIGHLVRSKNCGGLLVACKAANLKWATVDAILVHRHPNQPIAFKDLEKAKMDFIDLTRTTAARLLGFWQAQPDLLPP
jgi:uncharacterized protein (DUF2336 family)